MKIDCFPERNSFYTSTGSDTDQHIISGAGRGLVLVMSGKQGGCVQIVCDLKKVYLPSLRGDMKNIGSGDPRLSLTVHKTHLVLLCHLETS